MIKCIREFLDCCYILRRNKHSEDNITLYSETLARYHDLRKVFRETGVHLTGFSVPRQHSLSHFALLIREFGSPNGSCSSITESKHITVVKEPWRRSSKNQPLGQMLETNTRLNQLSAARSHFESCGMLRGSVYLDVLVQEGLVTMEDACDERASLEEDVDDNDSGAVGDDETSMVSLAKKACMSVYFIICIQNISDSGKVKGYPHRVAELATFTKFPELEDEIRQFLFSQLSPDDPRTPDEVPLAECPRFSSRISVRGSAVAVFYAPSDRSGINSMRRERIYAVPSWRNTHPRCDCIFVEHDTDMPGMQGLHVA